MCDVEPHLYATVIREMIRHENDVTNHRIMWLLIGQGLIANAAVSAGREHRELVFLMAGVGILVTMSAFVILYKSYQARGYLQFLGNEARQGTLRAEDLPLLGWPAKRVKGWRQKVWARPWIGDFSELLEPFFFLPGLLILAWTFVLLRCSLKLSDEILLILAAMLMALQLSLLCLLLVSWQSRNEKEPELHRNGPSV
jgi:hypothetical protein